MPEELTIAQMQEKLEAMSASVAKANTDFETYKAAEDKKIADMKAKYEADIAALKAEDETEEEKKKKMEAKKAEEEKKDEEEKKAMKAEIQFLRSEAIKPRIEMLSAAYKGKVTDDVLAIYKASWEGMTLTQLNGEIAKIAPFAASTVPEFQTPILPVTQSAFSANLTDELSADIGKQDLNTLFGSNN